MSEVTNEIRETINAVLDCVDYCCNRLEVSEEEQRQFFDVVEKDILMPSLKETIMSSLKTAIYGTKPSKYPRYPSHRVDYRALKHEPERFELDDVYFPTREEAESVRLKIEEYASEYDQVTIGYLYELIGEPSPYTAEYYGWHKDELPNHIIIEASRKGYRLVFPDPVRLEEFK